MTIRVKPEDRRDVLLGLRDAHARLRQNVTLAALSKRTGMSEARIAAAVEELSAADLVEDRNTGMDRGWRALRLTDRGWQEVGGKPVGVP